MLNLNKIIEVMQLMKDCKIGEEEAFKMAKGIVECYNLEKENNSNLNLTEYAQRELVLVLGQWKYTDALAKLNLALRTINDIVDNLDEDDLYEELETARNRLEEAQYIFNINKK